MKAVSPLIFLLITVVALVSLFIHTRISFELPEDMLRVDMQIKTPMGEHIINMTDGDMQKFAISEFNAAGFIKYPDYVGGLLTVVILGSVGFLSTVNQVSTAFDKTITGLISRIIRVFKESER